MGFGVWGLGFGVRVLSEAGVDCGFAGLGSPLETDVSGHLTLRLDADISVPDPSDIPGRFTLNPKP